MRRVVAAGAGVAILLLLAGALFVMRPWQGGAPKQPVATAPAPAHPAKPSPKRTAATKSRPPQAPRFDVVKVAPDGSAVVAGRAAPGAAVTILDNGKKLGSVTADARGEWVLVPDRPLPPGQRRLSLEATNPLGGAEGGATVASKQSVTLSVAARKPTAEAQTAAAPSPTESAAATPATQPATSAAATPAQSRGAAATREYVVKPGNSLWRIAHEIYGAGIRYLGIYSANSDKIRDPDLIYPGQVLKLPKKPEPPPAPTAAQG